MSYDLTSWGQIGISAKEANEALEGFIQESKQRAEAEKQKKREGEEKEQQAANGQQTQQRALSAAALREFEGKGKRNSKSDTNLNSPSGRYWLADEDDKRVEENARRAASPPPCRSAASSSGSCTAAAGKQIKARVTGRRSEHRKSRKLREALAGYWKNAEADRKLQAERDRARRTPRQDRDKRDGADEPGRLLQSGGRWL
ncbi:hypothetical protein QBC42DRAFT_284670 [Cladorrhinum samala]|uniref:Uncharacterized protein n=1 Tax=Cladorrhinum samala TaxID=585594 RepID=A0AAV9HVW2_9PEZI|nr:hypothetical protein QBC42DRAFT_284670 [Cladorrhinum samala]